ncbi:MAG TPA: subclass B3 metallo-beta-lactamase [Sphingomicrobium sp.]|nr:subclass B3 metallo-beta-lactamase [Sphingomicrobium sp.]
MFASLAFLVAAQGIVVPLGHPRLIEQPRAPIETAGPLWASRCGDSQDFNKPAPPVRIHANTYLVGSCGISSILIVGDQGDILIDGGTEEDADLIADNIRALGYRPEDIRFILTSHEHYDHVGGIAKLQRLSGATVVTSAAAAKVISSGSPAADDPQFGTLKTFPPAQPGRIVRDGDEVRLGNLMVTAIATPGHTAGAMSWRWISCDGGVCRTIVYADSLTPVSAPNYRFSDHPVVVAAFRASLAKIAASPCEILLTPHPDASDLPHRLALGKPLFDQDACKNYAAGLTKQLDDRLAKEAAPTPPKP